jgi:transcriptional regulator with XRE-family HTH domain
MSNGAPHPADLYAGAHLRELRQARGMSQSALGAAAGVTYQQVQKYETGRNRLSVSTLAMLAAALGVTPGEFFQ